MTKKIKFHAKNDLAYQTLKPYSPAKNYIPDWYKNSELWVGGNKPTYTTEGYPFKSVKQCMPFLDTLTSGYILELWQDIRVVKDYRGSTLVNWFDSTFNPVEKRHPEVAPLVPAPLGCTTEQFTWRIPFGLETPPGYSVLYSHPFNRFDLPFVTLTGIIDADETMVPGGNVPFFFSKDFEGIIPMGTPIAQIIPFKRDDWKSEIINDEVNYQSKIFNIGRVLNGAYRKKSWKKKKFD